MAVTAGAIRAGMAYVEIGSSLGPLQAGLRRAQGMLGDFGSQVQALGLSLTKMALAAAAPLALAGKEFMSFEFAMARVKAASEGLSEEGFKKLTDRAREMGLITQVSATDAARAMAAYAKAGWDANKILKAIKPTADLAGASINEVTGQQLSAAEAADVAVKAMSGLGLEINQLGELLDVLAKAAQTSNTELPQLGEALNKVGSISDFAGVQVYELVAALQVLSNRGQQAEEAGTGLRSMIIALAKPSDEATALLEKLNVRINDAQNNFRGFAPVVADLEKALSGMGTGDKARALATLFRQRQANTAATLFMAGAKQLGEFTERLRDSKGTLEDISRVHLDTMAGAVKLLVSSLQGLGIAIGKELQPMFRSFAAGALQVLNATSLWIEKNGELVRTLAKVILSVGATGAALFTLGVATKVAAFGLGWVLVVAKVLVPATLLLTKAFLALSFATLKLALAAAVSPVTLVVGALAAGAYAAYSMAAAIDGGERSMRAFKDASGTTAAGFSEAMKEIKASARNAMAGIREAIEGGDLEAAFEIAGLTIKAMWQTLWANLKGAVQNKLSEIGGVTIKVFNNAFSWLESAWVSVADVLISTWELVIDQMRIGWNNFAGFFKKIWLGLINYEDDAMAMKAMAEVDAMTEAANAQIKEERKAKQKARNEEENARRKEIEDRRKMTNDFIDESVKKEIEERNKAAGEAAAGTKAEIEAIRQKLRDAKELKEWAEIQKSMGPKMEGLDKRLPDVTTALGDAEKMTTASTFSAAVASMLGGTGVQERIARNTEKIAEEAKRAADGVDKLDRKDKGDIVFA